MKRRKSKFVLLWVGVLLFLSSTDALAEGSKKQLSMKTVNVLSVLPLNSPALFYARRPVAGVLMTATESFGLFTLTTSAVILLSNDNCGSNDLCSDLDSLFRRMAWGGIGVGAAFWIPSYFYALRKSRSAAEEYNVLHGESSVHWLPTISLVQEGLLLGVAARF